MPIAARLNGYRRDDTVAGAFQQIPDERSADAEAHHHELTNAEVVHQADMVVRVGVPCSAGLKRPSRLAALGVAQIGGDDAEFLREFVEGVEWMRLQPRNGRVEPTARDHEQRKPRPGLLVIDADIAPFIERHKRVLLPRFDCESMYRRPPTSGGPETECACCRRAL